MRYQFISLFANPLDFYPIRKPSAEIVFQEVASAISNAFHTRATNSCQKCPSIASPLMSSSARFNLECELIHESDDRIVFYFRRTVSCKTFRFYDSRDGNRLTWHSKRYDLIVSSFKPLNNDYYYFSIVFTSFLVVEWSNIDTCPLPCVI